MREAEKPHEATSYRNQACRLSIPKKSLWYRISVTLKMTAKSAMAVSFLSFPYWSLLPFYNVRDWSASSKVDNKHRPIQQNTSQRLYPNLQTPILLLASLIIVTQVVMSKTFHFFLMSLDTMVTEDSGRQKHFRLPLKTDKLARLVSIKTRLSKAIL